MGLLYGNARFRRYRDKAIIFKPSNGNPLRVIQRNDPMCGRCAVRIGRVLPGQRLEKQRQVADCPCHRPNRSQKRKWSEAGRQMSRGRKAARRRFQRADAGEMRGLAHRSAAVAAQTACRHSRRNRRSLASARSSRRVIQIPRIPRAAVQQVLRFVGHQELGAIRRSQNHSARLEQPIHENGILLGD